VPAPTAGAPPVAAGDAPEPEPDPPGEDDPPELDPELAAPDPDSPAAAAGLLASLPAPLPGWSSAGGEALSTCFDKLSHVSGHPIALFVPIVAV